MENRKKGAVVKAVFIGLLAGIALLSVYFVVVSLANSVEHAVQEFFRIWQWITALVAGFGIQVGLYTYLKNLIISKNQSASTKVLTASGTTSGAAMISCCAHYLANILPILGITGFITIVTQYQVQLFWIGLAANLAGIFYMTNKVYNLSQVTRSKE